MRWAWVAPPLLGLLALLVVFVILPKFKPPLPPATPAAGVVACPDVSPSPQLAVSPNPAASGDPITYSASGFAQGDPLFIVIDGTGDCTNPTAGTKVYNTSSYADPLATDPSPLPDAVTPGDYQVRACNQRPGEAPANCVQVPLTVTQAASPARTQ